jgi:phosphatidylglycerophosphate synthase
VQADAISAAGMALGIAAGFALTATSHLEPPWAGAAWLAAAAWIQLRLLANMLDGMVAVEGGRKSKAGPLWNEIPDRVSDSAALVGAGYAAGGIPEFGYSAALLAMLTAYIRAIGALNHAGEAFLGWFSKPRRMFFLTLACLAGAAGFARYSTPAVLALIAVGSAWTCMQRLAWIGRKL